MSERPTNLDELRPLLNALTDGALDGAGRERLHELLSDDPAARRYYLEHMALHAALGAKHSAEPRVLMPPMENRAAGPIARIGNRRPWALAASLLFAAAAVVVFAVVWTTSHVEPAADAAPAAVLTETRDVRWSTPPIATGAEVAAGDLEIESGLVRFTLHGGAEVTLTGRARCTLLGPESIHLAAGRMRVRSQPGFLVTAPGDVRIEDLGTEFTVVVDADGTAVLMHEGQARVSRRESTQLLLAGDALAVTRAGEFRAIDDVEAAFGIAADRITAPVNETYASEVRADRPIVYWRFDQAIEGRVLNALGTNVSAELRRGAALGRGVSGSAVRLTDPKAEPHVAQDAIRELVSADTYSIELWAQAETVHRGTLFSLGDAIYVGFMPASDFRQAQPSLRYLHRAVDGRGPDANLFHPYEPGRWHHVVAVKDADTIALFVDGVEVGRADQPTPLGGAAPTFALGRLSTQRFGGVQPRALHGSIDELAIYDYPLTEQRIAQHYRAMRPDEAENE